MLIETHDTPDTAMRIFVEGMHVFVADKSSGLQVLTVGNYVIPKVVGSCSAVGQGQNVHVSGDFAYVADYMFASKLQVINITDPTNPITVADCDVGGYAQNVFVSGDYAYFASKNNL